MSKTTELVRFPRDIKQELQINYPGVKMPELIKIMYNSSALKLETRLRQKDFTNKMGTALYGKVWKKNK